MWFLIRIADAAATLALVVSAGAVIVMSTMLLTAVIGADDLAFTHRELLLGGAGTAAIGLLFNGIGVRLAAWLARRDERCP